MQSDNNVWFGFASNLCLGLFSGGVLAVLISMISFQNRFKKSVNKMLFISNNSKICYDEIFYIDRERLLPISKKIIDYYDDFSQIYNGIEFLFLNGKFNKKIQSLYFAFTTFVSPFNSLLIKDEIHDLAQQDLDFYFSEARSLTKLKFYEFVHSYVDLYSLWDKKMLDFMIEVDEDAKGNFSSKDVDIKHETIKQIMAMR